MPTLTTYVSYVVMRPSSSSKPVYLRGIPAHVVREAKAVAARRGITLAVFVTEAIVRAIRQSQEQAPREHAATLDTDSPDPLDLDLDLDDKADDLSSEMRWFEQHRERLNRELSGEYAAIIEHEVVDHDADFDALARRVFAKHGLRNVFMPYVGTQVRPLRVRSPRMEAARLPSSRARAR